MDNIWEKYQNSTNFKEKEGFWQELVPLLIQSQCSATTSFIGGVEVINTLATKFLSAIDEECSKCEDSDNLVLFLSSGYGCQLLLALNFFANQITTCCNEICNLLISILPLVIQNTKGEDEKKSFDLLTSKNETVSSRQHFFAISKRVSGFVNDLKSSLTTSEESESSTEMSLTPIDRKDKLLDDIKSIELDRQQLFFHLVSALLGLIQNEVMSKEDDSFIQFIDKCFTYLTSNHNIQILLHHKYGICNIIFSLLYEVSSHKDGISKILSTSFYSNYQKLIQGYLQKKSQQSLVLGIDTMKHAITCLSQAVLTSPPNHNNETLKLLNKFSQLGFFDMMLTIMNYLDSTELESQFIKEILQKLDIMYKSLVKISKLLKNSKGFCNGLTSKSISQRLYGTREVKHNRKQFSSDEEAQPKTGMKRLPDSDQTDSGENEESAENVSDFDNFLFDGTTDSEMDNKSNKEKQVSKQKQLEMPTALKKDTCFVSTCLRSFSGTFTSLKRRQPLQLLLLQSMGQIGLCKCMDLDSFVVPIVSIITTCDNEVADKTLSLVNFLLSSNWDNLHVKSQPKRKTSSRVRSKSRSLSSSSSVPMSDDKVDFEVPANLHFKFLEKFKNYLVTESNSFKVLLLKHLKGMTVKMPLNMQRELFATILLQNFRRHFPLGKLDNIDVPFTIAEDVNLIKNYLDLIFICLTNNSSLAILFSKFEGIEILKKLSIGDCAELSMISTYIVDFLCWLKVPSQEKSKLLKKTNDEKLKSSYQEISHKAISAVFQVAHKQTDQILIDFNLSKLNIYKNFMEISTNVLDLFYEDSQTLQHLLDSTILIKFNKIFVFIIECLSHGDDVAWTQYLHWLKVLLPLQLVKKDFNFKDDIMYNLNAAFFENGSVFKSFDVCEKVFMMLLNTSVASTHIVPTWDTIEKEEINIDPKMPSSDSLILEDTFQNTSNTFEEQGYEADQDSDDSTENQGSQQSAPLIVMEKANTSVVGKTMQTFHKIKHPWLILVLLSELYNHIKEEKCVEFMRVVKLFLKKVFENQLLNVTNNSTLRQEGLLSILLDFYGVIFSQPDNNETVEIQDLLGKMIVHLSINSIGPTDLKKLFSLFKLEDMNKVQLSKIVLEIAKEAKKKDGPQYHLSFPAPLLKDSQSGTQSKLLHRTQTFMIPKQEPAFRQSQLRSHSLSSMYEVRGDTLKPISYSNQPSSWESSAIHLPLASHFDWPDKEFSICLWYMLEDNAIKTLHKETSFGEKARHNSIKLISQQSHESYGCEELYHLVSFGAQHAMFEVWIGARTGYFQFRWITSCYGTPSDEQLMTFDQAFVQHHSQKNKWNQLILSLVLPSEPHTAEIVSFLNGIQISSVQMKYPSKFVQSQTKLSLLVGHGIKDDENVSSNPSLKDKSNNTLKTGFIMVFQGKDSFMNKTGHHAATTKKLNNKPLIDQMKAVYLYQLGSNSTTINTEYQEYFSNQTASHMDSSLDWDSIVFKELSFCMGIINEQLVADKFPMQLLESPMEVLGDIKTKLQSSLMLTYNPRNIKEFSQYTPQLKTSGNIQHTILSELNPSEVLTKEGTVLPTTLFCNIATQEVESFKNTIHTCGGMSILLYLHAMVSEQQYSEEAQCSILKTIFSVQETCPYLLREMNDMAGYILIKRAIEQSPCDLNASLMKTLLEATCDGDLFLPSDDEDDLESAITINQNTRAVVKNVCILQMLLKDWTLIRKADFEVQEILWQGLETLVRPTHPHFKFNVAQFQRARVVENLLIGCQEVQQEKYFQLPQSICKLFIGVITNLLGQPVDLPVLKAVCSFLIAIHPTLDTLTLHSASNFYLIAKATGNSTSNVKLRDTSLQISRSARRRKTASFNEADLRPLLDLEANLSPQVILSQEDLSSGSVIQSEVIFRRGSIPSLKEAVTETSTPIKANASSHQPPVEKDETDFSFTNPKKRSQTPISKIKGHRRIHSDGNIRPSAIVTVALNIQPPTPTAEIERPPLVSAESQDYEIISDSELASSLEGHEEYLVVDGFIDQTMESFTPKASREPQLPTPDVLYHLRLGLMQLLKNTLMLLPDYLVTRVFGTILKVEHLLVLVNQTSDKLREVALENLIVYLQRGGRDCLANFNRFKGCHLLANQLHQHPITMRIVESCIQLLISKPVSLNSSLTKSLEMNEENVCYQAIVPCLTLLEGSIQRPVIFGHLVKFLLKVFDWVENLPLIAFDHGLAEIVSNIVCGLANEESGGVMTSWKKESFGHLLLLLDWLVDKACRTCQTLYFQMYKDLQLSLEHVDGREKEKKGHTSSSLLSKTCRFLKYYLIQSALNVFQKNDLYRMNTKGDPQFLIANDVYETGNKAGTAARSLIKRLRGGAQILPQPTIATPTEVQERLQDILSEAVKLATLFAKHEQTTDVFMFGCKLKCLGSGSEHKMTCTDADQEFCKDLFEWFCINLQMILSSKSENTSWCSLLKSIKEEVIAQASHLFINFVSPLRSQDLRLYFVRQYMKYKENKHMVPIFLLTHLLSKRREKFLACLNSILSIPHSQLSEGDVDMLKKFKKSIGKINLVKMNDQKLLTEMTEIKHKRKEEEMIKRRDSYKRILERNSQLCRGIADNGMEVSKVIVEEQDRQRQKLLRVVRGKVSKDVEIRKTWRNLIHHVTQERALWYHKESYPCSWQLDPTEGPSRMRKRLQRCHLEIAPKFFMEDAPAKNLSHQKGLLSYLFTEHMDGEQPCFYSFKTNDTIRFLYHCKRVTPATKNSGEVLIGETHMYFVGDEILADNNVTQAFFGDKDVISISWRYEEIHEILKRRYSLQDNALEIFLTSGRTFLLAFENTKSRDEVYEQLYSRELPNLATATMDLATLTTRWKEGHITNFEYLTELNKKAGRSFNDLMQYPVLPFIIADYESPILDLTNPTSFRNLIKPIACQDKGKEERYIENYEYLKADYEHRKLDDPENATPPYHYSSHYSNSGTVLHFLVRLPPFTSMFLKYQDNQFDIPDRTFHSMGTTWKLSSFISNTDVKELIPEFFFLQEFLQNGERYDMGLRQNKERVDNVHIPVWAKNNPRLFTLIHMQALESSIISGNIHHWIDLVFGFKQSGPAAIKATNVFHPATYFGVDVTSIKDAIHRRALETMIETYGQTPLQLFVNPHPKRFSKAAPSIMEILPQSMESMILSLPKEKETPSPKNEQMLLPEVFKSPLDSVVGIQWGDYCGSKSHLAPVVQWVQTLNFPAQRIISASSSLAAYLCQENTCVLTRTALTNVVKPIGILSWGAKDSLLQVQSSSTPMKSFFNPMRPDHVTCCEFIPELDVLFVGGSSGILNVWPVRFFLSKPSLDVVGAKQNLLGHSDCITSICICQPYSVAVTTSKDKTAIIWDLNRLCYIRSIEGHESTVQCAAVSEASGDIATACNQDLHGILYLWTINAKPVGRLKTDSHIRCLAFSTLPDGIAINVVAAGLQNGHIKMWDTWTLNPVRTMIINSCEPVTALSFSKWNPLHFFSADQRGNVYLWTSKDITLNKPPNFHLVALLP
ncbi:lysosomal-trafficking regulator-like [Clytia hemisphaerica]|uniref:Lysosomal-trafficking regulator n=1 Tax=Clytia hemisphaerica TaxID=252671 RepID=A0A7M5WYV6_9CNID